MIYYTDHSESSRKMISLVVFLASESDKTTQREKEKREREEVKPAI